MNKPCLKLLIFATIAVLLKCEAWAHQGESHEKSYEQLNGKNELKLENTKVLKEIESDYLERVMPIFKAKCFDCHGKGLEKPWYYKLPLIQEKMDTDIYESKKHVDMSEGFPFDGHGTPSEDLKSIGKTVDEESMPPWDYRMINWDSKLTFKEKAIIKNWVIKSLDKLKKGD